MFGKVRTCREVLRSAILKHSQERYVVQGRNTCSRFGCVTSSSSSSLPVEEKGLENITVAEVLMTKGDDKEGAWFCCRSNDVVDDAVKNVGFYRTFRNHIGHFSYFFMNSIHKRCCYIADGTT